MNRSPRTPGVVWFRTLMFCSGLLAVIALGAAAPALPELPQEGPLLLLPKGKPVTVSGLTMKGGAPAKQPTTVTITRDDDGLTVVFDCTDTAIAAEWAKERDVNKTWKDDSVGVLLDLGHNHMKSTSLIMLKLSAAGGLVDSRGDDTGFNVEGLTAEVTRTADGWRGKIHAPWKGLGVSPRDGDIWGVNFTRIDHPGKYSPDGSFLAWAPFTENYEGLQHFGHLVFAGPDVKADDATLAALREAVKQAHDRIVKETVFPNEGNVLAVSTKQPASAGEFRLLPSGAPPRQATRATVSWDQRALTVVFDCTDDAIAAAQQGQDNIKLWKDDSVYVWLDLGHTHVVGPNLVMAQVSASGAWHDSRNGDPKLNIEGLTVAVSRTDAGWRAQLVMPWAGLGVACPKPGEVWGLNLTRMDQRGKYDYLTMECSSWVTIPDGNYTTLDRWGHLVFAGGEGKAPADDPSMTTAQQAMQKVHEARRQAILGMTPR